jgi:hypothetical protein
LIHDDRTSTAGANRARDALWLDEVLGRCRNQRVRERNGADLG